MAKRTTGANKVQTATATPKRARNGIAVRLDLQPPDHERAARLARDRGLSLSSYVRMALFERMKDDEAEEK